MIRAVISVTALCLCFAAVPAKAVDVRLNYKRPAPGEESPFTVTWRPLSKTLTPPDGSWKLPELKSEYPLYAMIPLGTGERLLVVDRGSSNDPFYNLVYFDADGNGDLTDDPEISEEPGAGKDPAVPHPYTVKDVAVTLENGSAHYSFRINVNYKSRRKGSKISKAVLQRSIKLQVAANCWYEGELDLGGKIYKVCLGDLNGNGRFDDPVKPPDLSTLEPDTKIALAGDGFYLSDSPKAEAQGVFPFGDFLAVGGKLFQVDLDTASSRLTLNPYAGESAKLTVPTGMECLGLYKEDGDGYVMAYGSVTEVIVPPGKYRFDRYVTLRKDDEGDEWLLAAAATKESPSVSIAPGGAGRLDVGEPYHAFVSVPEWSRQGVVQGYSKQASLEFVIEGEGRERVTELIRVSGERTGISLSHEDKRRPTEPRVKVVDERGELAFEGSFKYG